MHFVYVYSANGIPFYVGKGKGKRDICHLYSSQKGSCAKEIAILKNTTDAVITVHRVADNLSNDDALLLERQLIKKYGRINLGTGTLVNRTSGGQGNSGYIMSEAQKSLISKQFKGKKHSAERNRRKSEYNKANGIKPPVKPGVEHPRAKVVKMQMPNGETLLVSCLKVFCLQNGLNMSTVRNTMYQKRPIKRGAWAGLMLIG